MLDQRLANRARAGPDLEHDIGGGRVDEADEGLGHAASDVVGDTGPPVERGRLPVERRRWAMSA
jgi:hypothetical protein